MDVTPYRYEEHSGWPPDGEPGLFFGFDADGNVAVLRWSPEEKNWYGVRWQFFENGEVRAEVFRRAEDTQDRVVKWAFAPLRWSEMEKSDGQEILTEERDGERC